MLYLELLGELKVLNVLQSNDHIKNLNFTIYQVFL